MHKLNSSSASQLLNLVSTHKYFNWLLSASAIATFRQVHTHALHLSTWALSNWLSSITIHKSTGKGLNDIWIHGNYNPVVMLRPWINFELSLNHSSCIGFIEKLPGEDQIWGPNSLLFLVPEDSKAKKKAIWATN